MLRDRRALGVGLDCDSKRQVLAARVSLRRALLHGLLSAVLGVLVTALTPGAHALETEDARARARTLGYAGVRAYGAGDYAAASDQLEQSYRILPVPSLGLWSARALIKLGRLLEAEQRYRAVQAAALEPSAPTVQHAARRTAELELAELEPRIPRLRVSVLGDGAGRARLTLDGVALDVGGSGLALPVDPGPHEVVGSCGAERSTVSLVAEEGREHDVVLRFSGCAVPLALPAPTSPAMPAGPGLREPPPMADPTRVPALLAIAAGGASLAVSGAAYFLARREHDELEANGSCDGERCRPGADLDGYGTFRTIHLATLVTGAVFGVAGVTLLVLAPGAPTGTSSDALPQLAGASVRGSF